MPPIQVQTWGSKTSDALSKRYTVDWGGGFCGSVSRGGDGFLAKDDVCF